MSNLSQHTQVQTSRAAQTSARAQRHSHRRLSCFRREDSRLRYQATDDSSRTVYNIRRCPRLQGTLQEDSLGYTGT